MINQVIHGDCLEVLKTIPDNYFDSLITDPPAGISFMGKNWDDHKGGMLNWVNWFSEVMNECLRTMKPGACGLVWSIPRTSHWTGMALELAGFRLIDCVHHCFGSGFPKGQDIGRLLDKMAGEERELVGIKRKTPSFNEKWSYGNSLQTYNQQITAPTTPEAKQWDGWKTPALKPAVEGWWLVQKPISESSIARNILKHGVGGINIEACRIGDSKEVPSSLSKNNRTVYNGGYVGESGDEDGLNPNIGRYPANLILSCGADCEGDNHSPDCPVTVIGEQSGISVSKANSTSDKRKVVFYQSTKTKKGIGERNQFNSHNDQGTAARFFKQLPFDPETVNSIYYQAKASTKDRTSNGTVENTHPTVKSTALMEYFIKLITPPGGIVLDPFGGSGTTGVAAKKTGFNYVLIEKEQEYVDIINQRLTAPVVTPQPTLEERVQWLETQVKAQDNKIKKLEKQQYQQLSLFG